RGAILFVSHDTSAVLNLCQRALWLDHGVTLEAGDAKTVVQAYMRANLETARRLDAANEVPAVSHEMAPMPSVNAAGDAADATPDRGAPPVTGPSLFDPGAPSFGARGAII